MASNYLKKYYLDDKKLAQRALLEFHRSLNTGRMIAFTGAMATQAHGYGSWDQLQATFAALALRTLHSLRPLRGSEDPDKLMKTEFVPDTLYRKGDPRLNKAADDLRRFFKASLTGPVRMSLIAEILDQEQFLGSRPNLKWPYYDKDGKYNPTFWPLDQFETPAQALSVALARWFRSPEEAWRIDRKLGGSATGFDDFDVPRQLWRTLGIRRFATVSYDLELERMMMLSDKPARPKAGEPVADSAFDHLRKLREANNDESFTWDLGSGRIRRVMLDGWALESDLLNRERIDRLIEFAAGTDDVDGHVMHLHGRADNWRSMIVSQRDYDALYRLNDLNRAPFEQARRMMMGGNPILFVGLGMGEAELNRELEEFISNSPYQRVAPTFLLWNAGYDKMNEDSIAAKRLDFLHRLGVLTIFDTDLGRPIDALTDEERAAAQSGRRTAQREATTAVEESFAADPPDQDYRGAFDFVDADYNREDLRDLAASVFKLKEVMTPGNSRNPANRENHIGKRWRSASGLIDRYWNASPPAPAILWNSEQVQDPDPGARKPNVPSGKKFAGLATAMMSHSSLCVIGPQGCGKGYAARSILERIRTSTAIQSEFGISENRRALLINGSFSFDTDSLLDAVAYFLGRVFGKGWKEKPSTKPRSSRREFLSRLNIQEAAGGAGVSEAIIIINGAERFFGIDGRPLSAELDELLRQMPKTLPPGAQPKVRFLLFGTERVRAYMDRLEVPTVKFRDYAKHDHYRSKKLSLPGFYLSDVANACNIPTDDRDLAAAVEAYRANATGKTSGDSSMLRRTSYNALFHADTFKQALWKTRDETDKTLDDDAAMARNILRKLAFLGSPAERIVLEHMLGDKRLNAKESEAIKRILKRLCEKSLVLKITGFTGYPDDPDHNPPARYVLHRSLLTELRYRFGIPLNEAKLSTAFNMSLYVAQPIDGDIPDCDIHDELGTAIDKLIGSYQAPGNPGFATICRDVLPVLNAVVAKGRKEPGRAGLVKLLSDAGEKCVACDSGLPEIERLRRVHALCSAEHVQCLRAALALCRSYYSTTGLLTLDSGDRLIQADRDGILHEHAERLDDLIDGYGKQALAREALRKGFQTLAGKEKGQRAFEAIYGKAEPFYADELVWLHNERGVVRMAMGDIYEARRSFDRALDVNRKWVERDDRAHNWRRVRLNQLTVDIEMGELGLAERKIEEIVRVSGGDEERCDAPNEDKLAWGIAHGYRGWCKHLRGQNVEARKDYDTALKVFIALNEVRAQAYFSRLRASALDRRRSPTERKPEIKRALHLAQSARQMDIAHRLQVTLADEYLFGKDADDESRQRANRLLDEAIAYALQADVHRVRCEASTMIARARFQSGDHEGALRYAMDAMMVATRYGMELRKITLRAVIARIMAARGDLVTAEHLARTCIKMATRQRYQTAIDKAERVLVEIPRISAAISTTDRSGRRQY